MAGQESNDAIQGFYLVVLRLIRHRKRNSHRDVYLTFDSNDNTVNAMN
jgi:hypothetical protein